MSKILTWSWFAYWKHNRGITRKTPKTRQASMRRYFYDVKVQVLTNEDGIPVGFGFVPGSEADVNA